MQIEAGSGHSAIEKSEETERLIRKFEAAPCMEIGVPGVALCCKTPGNLKSTFREGDVIRYKCIVCHRGHWRAFSEAGQLVLEGLAAMQRHSHEIRADAGSASAEGSTSNP